MFEPLPATFSFPEAEKRVLEFWEQHNIFQRSLDVRRGGPRFVFYEGPPTANGLPHPGHCLTRAIKDLFPRYQTMCGKLVERKAGWDTHGLPVEVEVCKELGIHTKQEIEAYGVEKFVRKCIESVFRYTREWEQMTRRLGFWVNLEDAYVTYHQSYVESVWWGLKTLFERGLLYQGHKVVWWWAQGGTALSAGEVGEGYRTVKDPSVYVRFPLVASGNEATRQRGNEASGAGVAAADDNVASAPRGRRRPHGNLPPGSKTSLLVWTTTPWTLISNHFAAVGPDVDYSLVHDETTDEHLYVATALVGPAAAQLKHKLVEVATCKGAALVGLRYEPPFNCYYAMRVVPMSGQAYFQTPPSPPGSPMGETTSALKGSIDTYEHIAWRVVAADFIDLETGTGIVHIAPAFGEVDFNLLQAERERFVDPDDIPLICSVAPDGTMNNGAPPSYRGRWVKDCDKDIVRELKERGLLLHQETIEHEYPFCPRAEDDALIQYARKSWFVRTSQFKDEFLANNDKVNWLPDHIQEGRFGDFLRNNVDWALSRERYWGTPLPIWACEQTGKMEALGSFAELTSKPGVTDGGVWDRAKAADPTLPDHLRVHKPYIDAWTYDSPFDNEGNEATRQQGNKAKARMRRVPEVIDCWWDAGSMPFAQWGFPHTPGSIETFVGRFPADFISEAIDQTRGWFYGLLAISTLLFGQGGSADVSSARCSSARRSPSRATGVLREPITAALHTRRRWKLPHWEAGGSTYFLTFRLLQGTLSPEERTLVLDACRHWDGTRLLLHAVVVMPDHVHLLLTPQERAPGEWWSLADLLHSLKGFTAKEINAHRGTSGSVWQQEYFDRIIRGAPDFEEKWCYVVENPVRRGLGEDYLWTWVEPPQRTGATRLTAEESCGQGRDVRAGELDVHTCGRDVRTPLPHPFKTCIVLGHVMGEDGLKMSKRTKNYKEPSYIFDAYGADAMRWFFFSAQAPWTSIRFQEANIRDAQREFLVRLYNVFSFFNIYANIDGFVARPTPECGHRPTAQRSELDRWIISELQRTIRFVRAKMDAFENYPAAQRLSDFVDALSNWYVRRSRDRFWRKVEATERSRLRRDDEATEGPVSRSHLPTFSPADQDKWDAYHTLYGVLWTLSKLSAPFTPFFAEIMYRNLVGADERSDDSVHLSDYPVADESLIDEALAQEMDLVRDIVSLGRAARTAAKLKVRQPLALAEIILARGEHTEWLEAHSALIVEELNIKRIEFTSEAEHYVTYQIKPDFKAIGPKFGSLAPQVAAALARLDPASARRTIVDTGRLTLEVAGQAITLTEDDVAIRLEAKPGWSAAQGRGGVVVVQTELTDELRDEGFCRELIHQVQTLRKNAHLPYEARITLYVQGAEQVLAVARRFADVMETECLAPTIEAKSPPPGVEAWAGKIEGHDVALGIVRA